MLVGGCYGAGCGGVVSLSEFTGALWCCVACGLFLEGDCCFGK